MIDDPPLTQALMLVVEAQAQVTEQMTADAVNSSVARYYEVVQSSAQMQLDSAAR
jgi:hypothetical protein